MKIKKFLIFLLVLILISGVSIWIYYLVNYINIQNTQIEGLLADKDALLEETLALKEEVYTYTCPKADWQEDTYNYLAIGNSITIHAKTSYWWSEYGMAATSSDKDYFHLFKSYLATKNEKLEANICSLIPWETLYTDRNEQLDVLDEYLSDRIDLITIQLGENVTNLETFETDFEYLINHIKEKTNNHAKIIVIGDFWDLNNTTQRDEQKILACTNTQVTYVSLSEIKDKDEYKAGLGTIVTDDDGLEHVIEHNGVANHPGDAGMEYIANQLINIMENL